MMRIDVFGGVDENCHAGSDKIWICDEGRRVTMSEFIQVESRRIPEEKVRPRDEVC